jgi:protease I
MSKPTDTTISSKQNPASSIAVLIISDDKNNDLELFYPYYRLNEAGYRVDVASPSGDVIKGAHDFSLKTSLRVADAKPEDYALLYLPGGKAPSSLRKDENVLKFVKAFAAMGKPIAAICHGPQILVSAGLVKGKRLACWPEVAEEITKAGGTFIDQPLVEDGQFITARWPGDLPNHLEATLKALEGKANRKSAA